MKSTGKFRLGPSETQAESGAANLLATLRQSLTSATQSPNSILHGVTDAARALSGAQGTALALRSNGVIICRARSGNIGPELGAPLSVESGISGECLRTASTLLCNDTATDERVDPEVCRCLGVRSLVVLPIRGQNGIAGILEAFSTRVCAFDGDQIVLLTRLAEIAEAAYELEWRAPGSLLAVSAAADKTIEKEPFKELSSKREYRIRAGLAIALLFISVVLWLIVRGRVSKTTASNPVTSSATLSQATSPPAPLRTETKPEISSLRPDPMEAKDVLEKAADIQKVQRDAHPARTARETLRQTDLRNRQSDPRPRVQQPVPPPSIRVAEANTPDELASLFSGPAPMPALEPRISQGATTANLVHRVDPAYPPQALAQRLSGTVTMDATVAPDGTLRDLKVISGPPVLVAAATVAVRQWRYNPALLNGTPIEVQKRITIIFKLP